MINIITKKMSNFLLLSDKEEECVKFGLSIIFHQLFGFVIMAVIGMILDVLRELVMVIFLYIPLRVYTGGFHAKKPSNCFLYSGAMFVLMSICLKFFEWNYFTLLWFFIIPFVVMIGTVHQCGKVFNSNHTLMAHTKQIKQSLSIMLIIYVSAYLIGEKYIMQYITIALNANLTLLIIGFRNQILGIFKENQIARK